MLSHARIWAAIDALAARNSLSVSGLAKRAGLDPTAFNKSKRRSADDRLRWPSTESLAKIMDATGATLEEFVALVQDRPVNQQVTYQQSGAVPLIGFAQAGAGGFFDDAGYPAGHGWETVDFPTLSRDRAYALEVQGDSMLPLYRKGDILIVDPGAALRRGDRVVVKTHDGEVMAKVLQRKTARSVELLSLNPDHPVRRFEPSQVDWIARVVWASQ